MFNIGPLELMVLLVVALLVVGPHRLPEVGRSIGKGIREFRKAQEEVQRSLQTALQDEGEPPNGKPKHTARAKPTPDEDRLEPLTPANGNGPGPTVAVAGEPGTATPASNAEVDEGPPTEQGIDVARTIGRGLAELRKAREELQQSFRVDIDDPDARG
jgi:sec-independent protein translocase protein TatA